MNVEITATTTVSLTIEGRPATIKDVQDALDVLRTEGIPDTFEISLRQAEDRVHVEGVPYRDQERRHTLNIEAKRAAVTP